MMKVWKAQQEKVVNEDPSEMPLDPDMADQLGIVPVSAPDSGPGVDATPLSNFLSSAADADADIMNQGSTHFDCC